MAAKKRSGKPESPFLFFGYLTRAKVSFVVVGGAALALHGIPRSTLDVDVVVPASAGVLAALFSAGSRAGLRSRQAGLLRISDPRVWAGQWVTFESARGAGWVDVFLEEPRVFSRLLKAASRQRAGGTLLCVASLKDLEKMKRKSGRPIDLADIALIQEKRGMKKGRC